MRIANGQISDSPETIFQLGVCMHEMFKLDPNSAMGKTQRDHALSAFEWGESTSIHSVLHPTASCIDLDQY